MRPEPPLVKDIGAFIDLYQNSPSDRKQELSKQLEQLQQRLSIFFNLYKNCKGREASDAMSIYSMPAGVLIKPLTADQTGRRRELISMHFAKDAVREDNKNSQVRYAISSLKRPAKVTHQRSQSKQESRLGTARMGRTSRGFSTYRVDKFGRGGYLEKLDVTKLARINTAAGSSRKITNIRYNSGEVLRQFRKSTSAIRMKREADIKNYNPADNAVLKKQIQLIRSFDALPKCIPIKSPEP